MVPLHRTAIIGGWEPSEEEPVSELPEEELAEEEPVEEELVEETAEVAACAWSPQFLSEFVRRYWLSSAGKKYLIDTTLHLQRIYPKWYLGLPCDI